MKKKNADGTDAPPQVTTIVVEASRNNANMTDESQDVDRYLQIKGTTPEITQTTNVEILYPKPEQDSAQKKVVKKIIIKKKKKPTNEQQQPI